MTMRKTLTRLGVEMETAMRMMRLSIRTVSQCAIIIEARKPANREKEYQMPTVSDW